jgi:hypothetical protein
MPNLRSHTLWMNLVNDNELHKAAPSTETLISAVDAEHAVKLVSKSPCSNLLWDTHSAFYVDIQAHSDTVTLPIS